MPVIYSTFNRARLTVRQCWKPVPTHARSAVAFWFVFDRKAARSYKASLSPLSLIDGPLFSKFSDENENMDSLKPRPCRLVVRKMAATSATLSFELQKIRLVRWI